MENIKTKRNRTTRMQIGNTIVSLMEKYQLSEITISQVSQTAGISRMTFYHYYNTKEDALFDYLSEVISLYISEARQQEIHTGLRTYPHLVFALRFFSSYEKFILALEQNGCYNILIQGVNQFLDTHYKEYFKNKPYHLYFYAGALLNVFIEWLKNDKAETPEEIAHLILSY